MLKTLLVDGDKGGVGKSLATRALVQCYLEQPADHRPRLVVFDSRIAPVADELRELLPGRTPRFDRASEVDRSDYGEIDVGRASRRSQRDASPAQLGWPQRAGASTIARRLRLARNKKQERKDEEA